VNVNVLLVMFSLKTVDELSTFVLKVQPVYKPSLWGNDLQQDVRTKTKVKLIVLN
jgi:hypothetical protein